MDIEIQFAPPVPPPAPERVSYTLTLSPREAKLLHVLVGGIKGTSNTPVRELVEDIYSTLNKALPYSKIKDEFLIRQKLREGLAFD